MGNRMRTVVAVLAAATIMIGVSACGNDYVDDEGKAASDKARTSVEKTNSLEDKVYWEMSSQEKTGDGYREKGTMTIHAGDIVNLKDPGTNQQQSNNSGAPSPSPSPSQSPQPGTTAKPSGFDGVAVVEPVVMSFHSSGGMSHSSGSIGHSSGGFSRSSIGGNSGRSSIGGSNSRSSIGSGNGRSSIGSTGGSSGSSRTGSSGSNGGSHGSSGDFSKSGASNLNSSSGHGSSPKSSVSNKGYTRIDNPSTKSIPQNKVSNGSGGSAPKSNLTGGNNGGYTRNYYHGRSWYSSPMMIPFWIMLGSEHHNRDDEIRVDYDMTYNNQGTVLSFGSDRH